MGVLETARRLRISDPVEMSATLAINTRVGELRATGHKVHHLGFGEARFPVHPKLLDALRQHAGARSYLPVAGLPELRRRIAEDYRARHDLAVDPSRVLVGAGSKSLLFAAVQALDGDVILPSPCWVSYETQIKMTGKRALLVPTAAADDYRLTPEGLSRAVTEARAAGATPAGVIVNSPSNPTGVVLSSATLAGLAAVARAEGLVVISDEIYARTAFGDVAPGCMACHYPEGTIVTSGLSKFLSLGGWRLGLAVLPTGEAGERLRVGMTGVAGSIWTSAASPVQYAALSAYGGDPEIDAYVEACAEINGRVTLSLWRALRRLGVPCPEPTGAFYLYASFAPWREALERRHGVRSSQELAELLLEEAHLATLPGSAFAADPRDLTLRLSTSLLHDLEDRTAAEVVTLAAEPPSDDFLRRTCPDLLEVVDCLDRFVESIDGEEKR